MASRCPNTFGTPGMPGALRAGADTALLGAWGRLGDVVGTGRGAADRAGVVAAGAGLGDAVGA